MYQLSVFNRKLIDLEIKNSSISFNTEVLDKRSVMHVYISQNSRIEKVSPNQDFNYQFVYFMYLKKFLCLSFCKSLNLGRTFSLFCNDRIGAMVT